MITGSRDRLVTHTACARCGRWRAVRYHLHGMEFFGRRCYTAYRRDKRAAARRA